MREGCNAHVDGVKAAQGVRGSEAGVEMPLKGIAGIVPGLALSQDNLSRVW
jgi:hypothetical protein